MTAGNFGVQLKKARETLGVTLKEAEEATKIRVDFLALFEDGNMSEIPLPDVYRRGFLRIYAEFLHLDSRDILAQLTESEGGSRSHRLSQEQPVPLEEKPSPGENFTEGEITRDARESFFTGLRRKMGMHLRSRTWQLGIVCAIAALAACSLFWKHPSRTRRDILEDLLDHNTSEMINVDEIPAKHLTLTASDGVQVFIRNKVTKEKLFSGTLKKGETKNIDYYDDVQISFSDGAVLGILRDGGENIRPKKSGAGWIEVRYEN